MFQSREIRTANGSLLYRTVREFQTLWSYTVLDRSPFGGREHQDTYVVHTQFDVPSFALSARPIVACVTERAASGKVFAFEPKTLRSLPVLQD